MQFVFNLQANVFAAQEHATIQVMADEVDEKVAYERKVSSCARG